MGNEMGNNNTSEFREEEQQKAEVGGNEVKEARQASDGADRVNGDHHIIEEEKEEGTGFNLNTTILALDEPNLETTSVAKSTRNELLDIKADSLVEDSNKSPEECKDALGLRLNNNYHSADNAMAAVSEETNNMDRVIGIDRGMDEDNVVREKGSNFNVITQASEDPKSENTSYFDAYQLLDTNRDANKEDDRKREKDSNFDTMTRASEDTKSEKTSDFDVAQILDTYRDTNKEDDRESVKGSNLDTITQASKDPKSERTSDLDADHVLDTDRDTNKEVDRETVKGSNLDTIIQASKDPSDFDVAQILDTNRDTNKEDDRESVNGSNLDTITQASIDPKSERTSDFDADHVLDTDRDTNKKVDRETVKGSNLDRIIQASKDPSDLDVDHVLDTDRDTNKEDDRETVKSSNLDTIIQASKDPKSEKTSGFDVDYVFDTGRDTNKEDDGESVKGSNPDTITQASKDSKSEKTSGFDVDHVLDTDRDTNKEDDGESVKGSNPNTITQASKDPKSEQFSGFDADQVIDTDQDKDNENDAARENGSDLNMITQAAKDPKYEKTSNFDVNENIDTEQDRKQEDDEEKGKGFNFDPATQASVDSKFEKPSNFDVVQVIDTNQDKDEEHDTETEKCSNFKTLHVMEDLKSENNSDLKSIHHEIPAFKAESLAGSSDYGSSQESKYCLSSSLKHTEGNGTCTKPETDMEKKKGDLIEPTSCHKYTMPAAKIDDTKDEETAIDLIDHNPTHSPPKESLVIESPKSSTQVPEVEEKCTVLKEESQLREEHIGTETIIQDNIPTQSMITNTEEFNTTGSLFENDAEETNVSPECVVENKNHNKSPGENYEDSDEEYLEISEQGMAILTSSIGDSKHMNEEIGETIDISTNIEHEEERREHEESLFEPHLEFQPQILDEAISTSKQEAKTTETKPSTNRIDEQNVLTTLREEDQESPGRTSNESNSDNSITHIEMRKSPSFNIDIQSEGRAGETEKIPLLNQSKAVEDSPDPMEKRVVKLGRSDSVKSRPSFPGFLKEKEESETKFEAIDQQNLAASAAKKAVKDLPAAPSPIRKGKRRSKSLIFGTCICCATAIN